jgi:hypothetical protein
VNGDAGFVDDVQIVIPLRVEASFACVITPALILASVTELLAKSVSDMEPLAILRLAGVCTITHDVPLYVHALPFDSK